MDIELLREYCLNKKGASEDFPFDDTTFVFKVGSKMFALCSMDRIPFSVNLKCDPERSLELRERYESITPGWHMNKKHWNTITPQLGIDMKLFYELIDHSYELVYNSLKKSEKEEIKNML